MCSKTIHIRAQYGNENPWSMKINHTCIQPKTNSFASQNVELESLNVVVQALEHSHAREKVVIHYKQANKTEAEIYADTFRHAQFLNIVLKESNK